ncbi:MAG: phage terminase large subunit GpA-like protein [Maricaulis maris]|jgi:phage terminase large subunit GpA-like protein
MADGSSVPGSDGPGEEIDVDAVLAANTRDLVAMMYGLMRAPPKIEVASWPERHVEFPEGSPAPGPYRHATAPYLEEILFELSPDRPGDEVPVIKCAQSGGTVVADLWLSCLLSSMRAEAMVIHPTVNQFKAWADRKYMKMVEASAVLDPARGGCVLPRHSRTEGGSKADEIKFSNGSAIYGAGSNSAASLRQHTVRFGVKDDLDGWAMTADEEGDPDKLSDQRFKTFMKFGLAKVLAVSTPLIARASRIMKKYLASWQGRFYMACKGCGAKVDWDFEDIEHEETRPYGAHLVCPECGVVHGDSDKPDMLAGGVWIACCKVDGETPPKVIKPEDVQRWRERDLGQYAGRPGFWITGVMNAFESLDNIIEKYLEAKGDPEAEKTFYNTVLGRVYEIQTETPDWEALAARKSPDFVMGRGAWGPLVFTLTVDVQRDGLYFMVKGWNRNEESWVLDYGFLAGETAEPTGAVWDKLSEIADKGAPLPGGARIVFDRILVDANYNTDAVKTWVKGRRDSRVLAINGEAGWSKPIIYRATETEVTNAGKRKRFAGLKIWHIGTYPAKNAVVARLRRSLQKPSETEGYATGVYHFPGDAEDWLFQQLTAEYVKEEEVKQTGLTRSIWAARGENHLFDCDVYALAALEHLGARAGKRGRWSDDQWLEREADVRRLIDEASGQGDLFDALARPSAPKAAPTEPPAKSSQLPSALAAMAAANRPD